MALLEIRGVIKSFGNVRANDGIDLDVEAGRIVGLLGENGSGKSTLMRIAFGLLSADAGTVAVDGRLLAAGRPADAIEAGLAMIHQHFTLVEAASVLDNVLLGTRGLLRRRGTAERIRETSARYGLELDPRATVAGLPLGRRQRVEILKALLRGARLLILDEPTSNLAPTEVDNLLAILRELRAAGTGIIFISHKLPEVLAICDEVVVLRAGRVAARRAVAGASRDELAAAAIGQALPAPLPRVAAPGPVRLAAHALRGPGLGPIELAVRAGEILGIAGVDGNGQLELVESLAGLRKASGRVLLDEVPIQDCSVRRRLALGLACIPADRATTGLVPAMTVAENLGLRAGRRPGRAEALALMRRFDIRAAGPEAIVSGLSGGNRQKIVVARELSRNPAALIAHQPAWGLDPGATDFVLSEMRALRDRGSAILYVSSELEEILALCDRVAFFFNGRLGEAVSPALLTRETIGRFLAGLAGKAGLAA